MNIWWDEKKVLKATAKYVSKERWRGEYGQIKSIVYVPPAQNGLSHKPGSIIPWEKAKIVYEVPLLPKDKEIKAGDIIFTTKNHSQHAGMLFKVIRTTDNTIHLGGHGGPHAEVIHFSSLFHRVVHGKFCEEAGLTSTPESNETPNETTSDKEPRCPICGGPLGSYMLAPACKKCQIFKNVEGTGDWLKIGTMELAQNH